MKARDTPTRRWAARAWLAPAGLWLLVLTGTALAQAPAGNSAGEAGGEPGSPEPPDVQAPVTSAKTTAPSTSGTPDNSSSVAPQAPAAGQAPAGGQAPAASASQLPETEPSPAPSPAGDGPTPPVTTPAASGAPSAAGASQPAAGASVSSAGASNGGAIEPVDATPHTASPVRAPSPRYEMVTPAAAAPASKGPERTTGPELSIGFGHSYAGTYGLQLAVPIGLGGWPLQVAPYVALGAIPGREEAATRATGAAGVFAMLGGENRLVVELGYGPFATRELPLHGYVVAVQAVHGLIAAAGYEFMSPVGLFFRACLGAGIPLSGSDDAGFAFSLGAGWKPW